MYASLKGYGRFSNLVSNLFVGSGALDSKSNNKIEILSVFAKAAYNVHGELIEIVLVAKYAY